MKENENKNSSNEDVTDNKEENQLLSNKAISKDNLHSKYNIWFYIFIFTSILISIFWVSTEFYNILFEYNIVTGFTKLSIIINTFDKKVDLSKLANSLMNQSISSYEIIITKNIPGNYSSLPLGKLKKKDIQLKFIEYGQNDTRLKTKIDCAKRASGEYILFLNPEDCFSSDYLGFLYKKAYKDEIDITQFNAYIDNNNNFNKIIYQPKIFDSVFFDKDIIKQNQFHLNDKIIKKEFFFDAIKDLDSVYVNQNNMFFDECFISFALFKKAESFIKFKTRETEKEIDQNLDTYHLILKDSYTKDEIKYILNYLKFLMQYTDNKVQEKRMASKLFIDILANKPKTRNNYGKDEIELLDEVINLYLKSNLNNEEDIKLINEYRKNILINNN